MAQERMRKFQQRTLKEEFDFLIFVLLVVGSIFFRAIENAKVVLAIYGMLLILIVLLWSITYLTKKKEKPALDQEQVPPLSQKGVSSSMIAVILILLGIFYLVFESYISKYFDFGRQYLFYVYVIILSVLFVLILFRRVREGTIQE